MIFFLVVKFHHVEKCETNLQIESVELGNFTRMLEIFRTGKCQEKLKLCLHRMLLAYF
jgi:hypothetical protein